MGVAGTHRLRLAIVALTFLAACGGSRPESGSDQNSPGAARRARQAADGARPLAEGARRAADDLFIGDVSDSLEGFAAKSPKQLETLYRVLLRNSASPQLAKMPGAEAAVQELGLQDVKMFANPKAYDGVTTPLAQAISQKARLYPSVTIVTDGMESDNFYLTLQEAVAPLAEEGWGVWLLLLPLPFDGRYYLEQPLNAETQLPRMLACAQQRNPGWQVSPWPGAQSSIRFTGERPLLLFMFDSDPERGRKRVVSLSREIEAELGKPEVVELSPLYLRGYEVGAASPESLGVTLAGDPSAGDHTVVADPEDSEPVKKMLFSLSWTRPAGPLPQPFVERWELERARRVDWADLQVVTSPDESRSPGGIRLTVDSEPTFGEWLRSFYDRPVVRGERMTFRVKSVLEEPVPGWWGDWDSVTTWECPHKVFKLASLVERVSEAARRRKMEAPPQEEHSLKLQIGTH